MDPKWTQNREKGVQLPKMAQDGAQEWSPPMSVTPWGTFLGPPVSPKISKNQFFVKKGGPRNACLSIFVANDAFLDFFIDFESIFHDTIVEN